LSAEVQTQQQNDQLRLLVESITDYAIFALDPDGHVTSWNAGAERIKGYAAAEVIGKHFSIFYPLADIRAGKPDDELRVAAADGRYEDEGWRIRKDGSTFWANVVITALRGTRGELVGFAKVTRDLTVRKRAEDRLHALQAVTDTALAHLDLDDLLSALLERIAGLLDVDTVAVLLLSDDGDALVARAAHGLEEEVDRGVRIPLGSGFAGRVAKERRPIVVDEVEHDDVLNPILRDKGVRSLMGVPLLAHDRVIGVVHVGALRPKAFARDDVRLLEVVAERMATAIDRAHLYDAARRARHEAAEAEAALRVRDEFLSIAAHELKTPLTSAKVAVQLLARSFDPATLGAAQRRTLETVDQQVSKLARLVSQLLEVVRIQGGRVQLEIGEVDVAALARAVIAQVEPLADRHQIVVRGLERAIVAGDALRIEQVLTNLVDNAIKYSPEGGPIEVDVAAESRHVVIKVRDHGIGVAIEHRSKLFDRFYQVNPSHSGMGLGLHICRQIVEMHGGTIYAEFPEDGGSRFVISLPVSGPAAGASSTPSAT
jgi:PAS domain S-box-containing protein